MRAIVIDDEQLARENLIFKLNKLDLNIDIVGEAEDIEEAEKLIKAINPDIIFLDISMPKGSGFDLLDKFQKIDFEIIFVTAYNQYALKAFQYFAIGYLLKPIEIDDLRDTVLKTTERIQKNQSRENIVQLSKYLKETNRASIIAIPVESGLEFIETDQIIKLNASEGYTTIYLNSGKKIVSSKALSYYINLLDPTAFFQVHRAFVINLSCIKKYHKVGFVQLSDGSEIPIAKSKKTEFLSLFKK
ncbi:LytTR family DNA-binding domain-containing protein [Saprospiraceae bacterium]|nr:LytTR family DNA-binding domain-containing protein [Saprospiraceae bacterium]